MSDEAITNELNPEDELAGDAAANGEAVVETAEPTLEEQLAAAEAEAAKNLDGWQRSQAELVNARKRFERQQADTRLRAKIELAQKLLPVIDDYDRAIDNVPEAIANDGWFAGIELVQRKLMGTLENLGVTPIDVVGQEFDPNWHEALLQEESDEYDSGIVIRELQKGYKLGERVVRPSLVAVAT